MSGDLKRWPGETDEAHPEIFNTIPPQPAVLKPGQLSAEQVKQYFNEGFLVVDSFFTRDELEPAVDSINQLVEDLANKLYNAGKVKNLYSECGYRDRLTMLERDFPGANIVMHKSGSMPQAIRNIWAHERLLNVVEQLLGTADIVGHPVWNLRTKTPNNEATTVPWHQDVAYLDNNSYQVFQASAWIPLIDSTAETGCMQMVRYGHKTGRVAQHKCCHGGTWYVMLDEKEIENTLGCNLEKDVVTCPIPFGGILLFNNLIPHHSLDNVSDRIRWSLDLRWQAADKDIGFYGILDGIRLRSSTDLSLEPDWDSFTAIKRSARQSSAVNVEETEFDTTIPGPWMKKWEIVHTNRHTVALETSDDTNWHSENLIVG